MSIYIFVLIFTIHTLVFGDSGDDDINDRREHTLSSSFCVCVCVLDDPNAMKFAFS